MRDLRIVFMGTPDFAVASLDALVKAGKNVVGVITAPDRPAGRGRKLKQSAVKEYAVNNDIAVLQPTNLKDEAFLEELKGLNANLQVVVAFRMLPEVVWRMPEYGTFNLHASLLPAYRGAAPINWAIINGETKTGATTFFIDEKIDTGEIIDQEELEIGATENAGSLHDRLMNMGSELLLKTVNNIEAGDVETKPQPKAEQTQTAYKLTRENTKVEWSWPTTKIFNLIRGLSPYPSAWCMLNNGEKDEMVKIYDVEIVDVSEHKIENPGTIKVDSNSLYVSTADGVLKIIEMQLPGKRKMKVKDMLNGYDFNAGAMLL